MTRPARLVRAGSAALAVAFTAGALGGCAGQPGLTPAVTVLTSPPTVAAQPDPDSAATAAGPAVAPLPAGRPGVPAGGLPAPATLASVDPDVVAVAGLLAYYGADTVLDTTPADATRRALPWLTGPLADATRTYQPHAAPGAEWDTWAAHRAHLVVVVARGYDDGAPADTATTAHREEVVTLTPHGPGGWTGTPVTWTDFLTLIRPTASGGWRIATLEQTG